MKRVALIAVLVVAGVMVGVASAAVRSGSVTDPRDAGVAAAHDIEQVRASYDDQAGRIEIVVRFHGAVSAQQSAFLSAQFGTARVAPCQLAPGTGTGFQTTTNPTDPFVFVASPPQIGPSLAITTAKTVSADLREITLRYTDTRLRNLDLRCVHVQVGSPAADHASFFLTGFTPTGPALGAGTCPNPTMVGSSENNSEVLVGTQANDRILGLGGPDRITALAGNDCLDGGDGFDLVTGDAGNDRVFGGGGGDDISGGAGRDHVSGGEGFDYIEGGLGNDLLSGEASPDDISGGRGADDLFGGDGVDFLSGGIGADELNGGAGADLMEGGIGRDRMFGQDGNDDMSGGTGADRVNGGNGGDRIDVGAITGGNVAIGGRGSDTIIAANGKRDRVSCGAGRDTAYVDGSDRLSNCERIFRLRRTNR